MRTQIILFICLVSGLSLFSQDRLFIHKTDRMTLGAAVAETDSIYFSTDQSTAYFRIGNTVAQFAVDAIDSLTFGNNSDTVYIAYDDEGVSVINPRAFEGVDVVVQGLYVTVTSTFADTEIYYNLSGEASTGNFKIYSDEDCSILLNGLELTNPVGPAINIQSKKDIHVVLMDGTSNILADGQSYNDPPAGEDQKAAFFSEGDLHFGGGGSLTINGNGSDQHALSGDDEIEINSGTFTINCDFNDGINGNDEIQIDGGVININVDGDASKGIAGDTNIYLSGGQITIHNTGDAVLVPYGNGYNPSYCTAVRSDHNVFLEGAELTVVASGKASRGVAALDVIEITAGNVQVTSTGNGAIYTNHLGEADAYTAVCLNSEGNIDISGGTITTTSSGSAGKGLNCPGELTIGSPDVGPEINITTTGQRLLVSGSGQNAKYAEAKAIKSTNSVIINQGNITISSSDDGIKSELMIEINGGNILLSNSKEGFEAPYININNGTVHIYATDDCINGTYGNGGEQNDGSMVQINGGYVMVSTTGGDGLDSNGDMELNGGTIIVHGPPSAPEVGMDFNGTCEVNGGFLVVSGTNSNMTEAPGNGSDQKCLKIMSNQQLSSTTLFHIEDASGNNILTFQPMRNYFSIIFSSADLQTGVTYSIYTGGTCTGTVLDGLYTGGVYSGGNFRKSFSITGTITNVNF